ncbi:Protein trichome birefringence-like 6 [Trifolium repens]|nr:Protein trichome birefringence-like 6 [Trifolium repens]
MFQSGPYKLLFQIKTRLQSVKNSPITNHDPKRVYEARGRKITKEKGNYSFRFLDYQCAIEYYVSHFLVHESKARVGQKRRPTLRIDAIDHGSSRWRGADI